VLEPSPSCHRHEGAAYCHWSPKGSRAVGWNSALEGLCGALLRALFYGGRIEVCCLGGEWSFWDDILDTPYKDIQPLYTYIP